MKKENDCFQNLKLNPFCQDAKIGEGGKQKVKYFHSADLVFSIKFKSHTFFTPEDYCFWLWPF